MVVAATSGYTALVLAVAVAMLTPHPGGGRGAAQRPWANSTTGFAVLLLCPAGGAVLHCCVFFWFGTCGAPAPLQQVGVYLPPAGV